MGRKLLADPELPNKLASGAVEDIRPCMYHYRCISQIFVSDRVACAVNAFTGREDELQLEPTADARSQHGVAFITRPRPRNRMPSCCVG